MLLLPLRLASPPAAAAATGNGTAAAAATAMTARIAPLPARAPAIAQLRRHAAELRAAQPMTVGLAGHTASFPVRRAAAAATRATLLPPPAPPPPAPPPPAGFDNPQGPPPGQVPTDWTPYDGPFGRSEAAHLLHRAAIGPRFDEIEQSVALGLDGSIDALLAPTLLPAPPGAWALEPIPDVGGWTPEMIDSLIAVYGERRDLLRLWWSDVIIAPDTFPRLREQMTLFWHDHFATGGETVLLPQSMYVQNDLFRRHATGNFRELARAIVKDPAMLLWLNGDENYVGHLNENLGRELLELFTLGLDQYTQDDVVAAARSLTGWVTLDGLTGTFIPERHDEGQKTFLGQTGNWDADDIIDIIFQQEAAARFIVDKLYRTFVDEYPHPYLIEDLAQTLRDSDYELRPVLERLLRSEHFFDPEYRGSVITSGIDRSLGVLRSLGMQNLDLLGSTGTGREAWVRFSMVTLGQILFEPPNVAGWPGYRTWVNSNTLPWRKTLATGLVDGNVHGFPLDMQLDALAFANTLSDPNDALKIVDDVALGFFGLEPTPLIEQTMLDELLQGAAIYDWSILDPEAEARIQGLVRLCMRLPDYQIK